MAELAMGREDWCNRLAVCAAAISDLLVGYWVEHAHDCPAIEGDECSCGLLAMFSTERAVIAVDESLGVAEAPRH